MKQEYFYVTQDSQWWSCDCKVQHVYSGFDQEMGPIVCWPKPLVTWESWILKHQNYLKNENPKQQENTRVNEEKILLHNSALRRTHVWDLATERCSRYKVASTWIIGPVVCWSPPLEKVILKTSNIKNQQRDGTPTFSLSSFHIEHSSTQSTPTY